jgi:hypothetical protein
MANMSRRMKRLTEDEIDEVVTAQADDDLAWEKPVKVRRRKGPNVPLPSELAARAAFFARLHHETSVEKWIQRIVHERIDLEEAAFAELKRELAAK